MRSTRLTALAATIAVALSAGGSPSAWADEVANPFTPEQGIPTPPAKPACGPRVALALTAVDKVLTPAEAVGGKVLEIAREKGGALLKRALKHESGNAEDADPDIGTDVLDEASALRGDGARRERLCERLTAAAEAVRHKAGADAAGRTRRSGWSTL